MNYDSLKVAELQELCRDRGLKTARAKSEMIERLELQDMEKDGFSPEEAAEALLLDAETVEAPEVQPVAEEPSEVSTMLRDSEFFYYPDKHGWLDDAEHNHNIYETERLAREAGHSTRGGAFRVGEHGEQWIYKVGVR